METIAILNGVAAAVNALVAILEAVDVQAGVPTAPGPTAEAETAARESTARLLAVLSD